ncbi:MAG: M28 family peptidase [Candidatus Aminicenantes bacterium]|nr:M28 family peptidase [Candidatus Aminicenantes bacterium]
MRNSSHRCRFGYGFALILLLAGLAAAQSRGLKLIRAEDMSRWLEFLAAPEFEGRNSPSTPYTIAARYVALEARRIGLKPLLPGGEWFQPVPVEVTTVSAAKSRLRVVGSGGEQTFFFPQSFVANPRGMNEGTASGGLVLVEPWPALPAAELEKALNAVGLDFRGKIVVTLASTPPAAASSQAGGTAAMILARFLRSKGAAGMVTIITPEREKNLAQKGLWFDVGERLRFPDIDTSIPGSAAPAVAAPGAGAAPAPFYQAEVRHDAGAAILGLSRPELEALFDGAGRAAAVTAKEMAGRTVEIAIYFDVRAASTPNVVGWIEGSDSKLKDEFVVLSSHIDHLASREGRIFPGADDNGSATVGMLSLAKALTAERPRRSIVFLWNTCEEDGLVGAYYFVQHCPVPVDKISANLNMDMLSRNDPGMIYLIGSNKISSELDRSFQVQNERSVRLRLDYTFESPTHPDRFFFRSDQYPFIRFGIPGVWVFCGTTPDYHQATDSFERADLAKAEKVVKLVYLVALDIGNKPALLKLDLNPEIATRGAHNMRINWQRPAGPTEKR